MTNNREAKYIQRAALLCFTYIVMFVAISDKSDTDMLMKYTDDLRNSNVAVQINGYSDTGSDQGIATLICNKLGECVNQESNNNCTVYMRDNKAVLFGDSGITYGPDCNLLDTMSIACKYAAQCNANVYVVNSESSDYMEYNIDIAGWDNLYKMYSYIDESLANNVITTMKNAVKESNIVDDDTYIALKFSYIIKDNKLVAGASYISFKENPKDFNDYYTNWYFDTVVNIGDWSLSADWYMFNYSSMSSDSESANKLVNMLSELHNSVMSAM